MFLSSSLVGGHGSPSFSLSSNDLFSPFGGMVVAPPMVSTRSSENNLLLTYDPTRWAVMRGVGEGADFRGSLSSWALGTLLASPIPAPPSTTILGGC